MCATLRDDISGKTFGMLTAVRYVGRKKLGSPAIWLFRCACGNEKEFVSNSVKTGNTKSCGCAANRLKSVAHKTHGISNTHEYASYKAMLRRCYDTKNGMYHRYGGRGITVCARWLGESGPANFLQDMGKKPNPTYTLERVDNNAPYSPTNCRWATRKEQADNRCTTKHITINGVTKNQAEWDSALGNGLNIVGDRVRRGWSKEASVNTPKAKYKRELTHNGETRSLHAWEDLLKLGHGTLAYRIDKLGWSVSDALTIPSKKRVPLKRFSSQVSSGEQPQ